jgi:hypothetical protein
METPDDPDRGDTRTSKEKFLALPVDSPIYCSAVDTVSGLWAFCKLCDKRVLARAHRPFTIGNWNAHLREVANNHKSIIALKNVSRLGELRQKATMQDINSLVVRRVRCLEVIFLILGI